MIDFFISYSEADQAWAEWIAWQLEDVGYSTILQAWDFRPGSNFVHEMHKASTAERIIAVLSPDYLDSRFTQAEWDAAFSRDPLGENGTLLPVRVRECDLYGLLSPIVYIDMAGCTENRAKELLLVGVDRGRTKPLSQPIFPRTFSGGGAKRPLFPGESYASENPFFTAGSLPADAQSYVERQCDKEIRKAIEEKSFMTVHGTFEIGKTSLLVRLRKQLDSHWNVLIRDLNDMRTENAEMFDKEFFRMISQHFEGVDTWKKLETALQEQRSIFLLDEFGALTSSVAAVFIPKIFRLTERVGSQLRVIVTLPYQRRSF